MQLPKFYESFLPILKVLANGDALHRNDLRRRVRDQYFKDLSEDLLKQVTKSGDPIILNRIGWGMLYLKQAGMIIQPSRAMFQITEKGRSVLQKGSLTLEDLYKDKEFLAKRKVSREGIDADESGSSPQDLIDSGFKKIEKTVCSELLTKLKEGDPYYFQRVVLLLLSKMGYGDFLETPKSRDGGIDGVINEDKLGLEKIYVQAKRYTTNEVHEIDIRNFIGAMSRDTNKGVFVTTSTFDERAKVKAKDAQHKIVLIDGERLVELMYFYDVGVQKKNTYEVKEVDEDFFEED